MKAANYLLHDLEDEASESDDDEAPDQEPVPPATPRSSTRSNAPHPRRHRGHIRAPSPGLDQVTAVKKQLDDLQRQMANQAERIGQRHAERLKQAEKRNKQLHE